MEGEDMSDYISREAALVAIKNLYPGIPLAKINLPKWHETNKTYMECELAIEDLPAADVQEVKRGRWELNALESIATCSECECCIPTLWKDPDIYWNYCPNCGADMRGADDAS